MQIVYQTTNGRVVQDDAKHCFFIVYKGQEYKLSACGLIALKIKLDAIDMSALLLSDERGSDLEIISLCNTDRLLVLAVAELVEFADLIPGSLAMLELNTLIYRRISSVLV